MFGENFLQNLAFAS